MGNVGWPAGGADLSCTSHGLVFKLLLIAPYRVYGAFYCYYLLRTYTFSQFGRVKASVVFYVNPRYLYMLFSLPCRRHAMTSCMSATMARCTALLEHCACKALDTSYNSSKPSLRRG